MPGLAFPSNGNLTPDVPDSTVSPATPLDDIPIDPALSQTPVDSMLSPDTQPSISPHEPLPHVPPPEFSNMHTLPPDQWSQERLPEGDPFAPQNTIPYLPIITEPPVPQHPFKPQKKKRRLHRRDEKCSFCQGNDAKNKHGRAEPMVTCSECGRSGHPSCMELSKIGDMIRTYPWKCIECKNCELCGDKGDDERILFCDGCDRGWHFDCMQPPINELPEGEWYCPPCQNAAAQEYFSSLPLPSSEALSEDQRIPFVPPLNFESNREHSIASSSHSDPPMPVSKPRGRPRKNPKRISTPVVNGEAGMEGADIDVEGTPGPPAPKVRSRKRGRPPKYRPPPKVEVTEEDAEGEAEVVEQGDSEEEGAGEEEVETATPIQPRVSRKRKHERDLDSSPSIPRVRLRLPTTRNSAKGKEKEETEMLGGLFDGVLSLDDGDTSKTSIVNHDKQLFEKSRLEAERKLAPPPPPPSATSTSSSNAFTRSSVSVSDTSTLDFPSTGPFRPTRSSTLQHAQFHPTPSPVPSTPGTLYNITTRNDPETLRIKTIRFGQYDIKTWYDAPFPEEYASIPDGRMWICEFCLRYMKSRFQAMRHRLKCKVRHPPGDEIYRDGAISIFEVDGRKNKIYCQNLCLLSKMFLDHKSLFYDVEPFLFYVITEVDDTGARFVGYFSKEKRSLKEWNLSCIMTLPVRQRQGWGNLLIDFSYLLSKVEQRTGSPEKPLSSLGALGYKNYWTLAIMRYLVHAPEHPRLEDISSATAMTLEDVYETLVQQHMIFTREPTPPPIKPSPGQAIRISKSRKNSSQSIATLRRSKSNSQMHRAPSRYKSQEVAVNGHGMFVPPRYYEVRFEREKVEGYIRNWEAKGYLTLKAEKLQWTPYLLTRSAIEEAKAKEKKMTQGKENAFLNGRHEVGSMGESPAVENGDVDAEGESDQEADGEDQDQDQEEEEEDELPILRRRRRDGTQTPKRAAEEDGPVTRRLRSGVERGTPTPEAARAARWRNRTARKEEEEESASAGVGKKPEETGGAEMEEAGCVKMMEGMMPVSDERSTLVEMEMGDEDAEGSSESEGDGVYSVVE